MSITRTSLSTKLLRQTESQAEHHLDRPEKAVLSFLKGGVLVVREHTAGGLSGLEEP